MSGKCLLDRLSVNHAAIILTLGDVDFTKGDVDIVEAVPDF